jgi:hypothetical protein
MFGFSALLWAVRPEAASLNICPRRGPRLSDPGGGPFLCGINPDLLGIYHPFFPEHEHFSEIL